MGAVAAWGLSWVRSGGGGGWIWVAGWAGPSSTGEVEPQDALSVLLAGSPHRRVNKLQSCSSQILKIKEKASAASCLSSSCSFTSLLLRLLLSFAFGV